MGPLVCKITAAGSVAALLLLTACVTPQTKGEPEPEPRKSPDVELAVRESEQKSKQGDFDGALGVYDAALQEYPGDRKLLKQYLEAVEDIRDAADDAFDHEEFARSGRSYAVLLRNYPHFKEIAGDLSFDRKYLRTRLKECSDSLSKRALTQYRQGNIDAAISLWKDILEFDPKNAGVKKAIETASTQLKNLKRKTE